MPPLILKNLIRPNDNTWTHWTWTGQECLNIIGRKLSDWGYQQSNQLWE